MIFFEIVLLSVEDFIDFHQLERIFVGESTHHTSIEIVLCADFIAIYHAFESSVDFKGKFGEILFQSIDSVIHKWRNCSVLSWIKSFQKCFSGMDNEMSDKSLASSRYFTYELLHKLVRVKIINAESAFNSTIHFHCFFHSLHTVSNKSSFFHETSTKRSLLDPWGRTAYIQVDLIITILLSKQSCFC